MNSLSALFCARGLCRQADLGADRVRGRNTEPSSRFIRNEHVDAATWGQFFLKFLLGNPLVTAVIPGTGNAEHMIDNLGAGRGRMPDAQQREKMVAVLSS